MSLEQAIIDNSAALRELAEAIRSNPGAIVNNAQAAATTDGDGGKKPRGPGRPKKADAPAPAATTAAEPAAEVDPFADPSDPVPAKTYTVEDVRKALIELSKKDKPKATAILKSCKNKDGGECASIGEIKPDDYARVVQEATAAASA